MSLIQDALKRRQSELREQMNQPPVPVRPSGTPPPLPGERLKHPPPATIPSQAQKVAKQKGTPSVLLILMGMVGVSAAAGAWWFLTLEGPEEPPPLPPPSVTITPPPKTPMTDVIHAVTDMTNQVHQKNDEIEAVSSAPFQFTAEEEKELLDLANTFDQEALPTADGEDSDGPPTKIPPENPPDIVQVDATGHKKTGSSPEPAEAVLVGEWPTMKIMGIVANRGGKVGQVIIDSNIFTAGRSYKGVMIERIEPNFVELSYRGDVERFVAGENTGNR